MALIRPEDWRPRGIESLEPAAWIALRHKGSCCVVAGPGAGKTEFLAQRAAYLLETGICPAPYRVLAISFKSDAAENLAERVRTRCPPKLANRFNSFTFDSFTKGLVDRFQAALPIEWRPSRPYDIVFPKRHQVGAFIGRIRQAAAIQWQATIDSYDAATFESHTVGAYRLPISRIVPRSAEEFSIHHWWREQLDPSPNSALTFVSLNRLAELLLRMNPHIRRALQNTYPFVFIDEFQDTTFAQYDFLLSAFCGVGITITGVGDDKQRIMTWAGARPDSFKRFSIDFGANRISLLFNFRSSPDLVHIQHIVAKAIDPNTIQAESQARRKVDDNVAQVWNTRTKNQEATHLARWITNDMATRDLSPRDYAILVKQRSDDYEKDLSSAFADNGLKIRNESHTLGRTTLQDLLSDNFAKIATGLLRLGASRRAPHAWSHVSASLLSIRSVAPDDKRGEMRAEAELSRFIATLRADMVRFPPSHANANSFVNRVVEFIDLAALRRTYIEYTSNDLLDIMEEAFRLHLADTSDATDWIGCLDAFEGVAQIPMMTVHKSKGLEYDTIVFIGLDDEAWWAHTPGDHEGLATFFVALSRAKQRAIFSFCQQRGQRQRVAELFQLLAAAGVPEITV